MDDKNICVIGLGYVGLPLAVALSKRFLVIGYDHDGARIKDLKRGYDSAQELSDSALKNSALQFTDDITKAHNCSVYIITVPTPLLPDKRPDLSLLKNACAKIGDILKKNDLVIVESTVYPGVTEDFCAKILAARSQLVYNEDFYCGYSPERINPSDASRPITAIIKITAGSTAQAAMRVDAIYRAVISAGTHRAPSIRVAEAAKVIENTQRDVNIALMNEFAMLCDSLNLDSATVFEAAASKWNFLKFTPGLVGGHCIGVDPYYLSHKAQTSGYHPNLILAARQINDFMGRHIANKTIHLMLQRGITIKNATVLILGFAFKENCPDPRNSRVNEIRQVLQQSGCVVSVCDPIADARKTLDEYQLKIIADWRAAVSLRPDVIIFAVAHQAFNDITLSDIGECLVIDVKGCAPRADWRL